MKKQLLKSIFVSLILVMGISNAWAASEGSNWYDWASSENVYFDNTNSSYSNVSMLIGRQWNYGGDGVGSSGVNFTKVDNTNNLYHAATTWNKYTTLLFMDETGWGWEGNKVTQRYTYAKNYTNTNNIDINGTELFYAASSSKGATLNHQDLNSYTALNYTQTIQQHLSTDGGSNYSASTTALATVKVSSYKLKSTNTTESSSGTIASGSSSTTCSAARTATVTYTVTDVESGYTFVGWYDDTTQKSTSTTYTYNATAAKTITVRFKANQYTVKFDANRGTGTMSNQSYAYGVSQALTANAFTRTGYTFEGWNTNADGTGTSYTDKQSVSNLSSTDGATITLYAQWAEIPANNHNITYTTQATGWTYGTTPASAEEGTTVTFVVNPTTGYTVTVTSDDVTLNKNENEYTFTMPTKDVAIKVSATENTHNVIVSYKCGDETIKADATVEAVGEVTPTSVTAPEIDGYVFSSWTIGSGIQSADANTNPISITTKASGDYTLTANYTKMVTVYLINNSNWTKVYAYGWKNGEAQGTPAWPGAEITANKLAEKHEGYDVYSYKVKEGSYDNVIFNNNSGKQTETFAWTDGKYYYAVDPLGSNVYLAGEMNEWSDSANEFKKATADATTASVTVNLAAQTYKFKLVIDDAWKGNTGTMKRGGESVHEGGWSFDNDGYDDNCQIVADIEGDYTFTWNLIAKKLTVAYPPLPKYTVTATAENGTVEGTGEYELGSEATLVATPDAGYAFKNWTKGSEVVSTEATYTFTVTANVELVANFVPEETHEVTVSYLCNTTPIPGQTTQTLAVGVTTPSTITAPTIKNYKFDSWTMGTGVQSEDATTANPIQITTLATGDYTLAANYTKIELTYNVTVPAGTPACYIAGEMNSWTLTEMTKVDDTHYTITIDGATTEHKYKYACGDSWDYVELKEDGSGVADRTYNPDDVVKKWSTLAKCYLMGNGDWVNGVEMKYDSENSQYILLCHHISAPFKFKLGDEWSDQVENNTENGVTWTDENADGNFDINLPEGDYNFYFKKDSKKAYIEVSTPALTRTIPVGYYATVCLPNDIIKVVGATLFEVAGKDGDRVIFDEVITPVAGMPYIFLTEENQISFYCGIETAATPGNHKSLHGTFENMTDAELDGMYMVQNNRIVKCAATGCSIPANRAYFNGTELDALGSAPALMPGRRRITMGAESENEATGTEDIITPSVQFTKKIVEGQLIIIRDGVKYNAQGQKL